MFPPWWGVRTYGSRILQACLLNLVWELKTAIIANSQSDSVRKSLFLLPFSLVTPQDVAIFFCLNNVSAFRLLIHMASKSSPALLQLQISHRLKRYHPSIHAHGVCSRWYTDWGGIRVKNADFTFWLEMRNPLRADMKLNEKTNLFCESNRYRSAAVLMMSKLANLAIWLPLNAPEDIPWHNSLQALSSWWWPRLLRSLRSMAWSLFHSQAARSEQCHNNLSYYR